MPGRSREVIPLVEGRVLALEVLLVLHVGAVPLVHLALLHRQYSLCPLRDEAEVVRDEHQAAVPVWGEGGEGGEQVG